MTRRFAIAGVLALLSAGAVRAHAAEHGGGEEEAPEATEPIAETQEDLTKLQTACTYGCAIAAGAGCAAVGGTCTAGTIWTVGGASFPRLYAVIAACGAHNAIGVSCAQQCSR